MAQLNRGWLSRLTEAHLLLPGFALLLLGLLWGFTLNLINTEHANANEAALASSTELAATYEAQVVRAIREIDLALKVVRYAAEHDHASWSLAELDQRELLPPSLLFTVSTTDRNGNVVESTRPLPLANVAEREYFRDQLDDQDGLSVGLPRQDPTTGEWIIRFARRLEDETGTFAGVAIVSVAADFFVSGYEGSELGEQGVLGILGDDGVFRARRSGDVVAYAESVDYNAVAAGADGDETPVTLMVNPWDGVERYTSARRLYDVPLTVIVGLSRDEQLAFAGQNARVYRWRATAATAVLLLVIALLGRLSRRLAQSQKQVAAEQMAHAKRVEHLAYHDGLTGLPNRALFSKLLRQAIAQATRHNRQMALLFLDLDRFKHINDTLGHEAGDQLLQEVSRRLEGCLRVSDTVARLGGDEFVVVLPELGDPSYAATVAQKVNAAIARPFALAGHDYRVTGSVGIATFPEDGRDEDTLTKNADTAMYEAKQQGKNTYQFYSPKMNTESLERLALESSLRGALDRGELEVHYQAKRDLKTGRITGAEALLRWQHPDLGQVAPLQFLAVAEQTGLIIPIGRWVLETACRQNVAWRNEGLAALGLSVNLSALQFFDEQLAHDVGTILERTGMTPSSLELEVSEQVLLRDIPRTLEILAGLEALGVRVAIDDFGLGYTTLASLQRFPVATIKIDRSFIRDLASVAEDKDLTEAIIQMGRALSLTVVAQGVETQDQVDFLRAHACDELQGFYFNRPVPGAELGEVLRTQAASPTVVDWIGHLARKGTRRGGGRSA